MALNDGGSHCNKEEWLKELKDTCPANEAEGHTTTSATRTKLLENRRNFETSTMRESSADVNVDNIDFKIPSFWVHEAWFQKMSGEQEA